MNGETSHEKDDVSQDYLNSRQLAHEFHAPGFTAFMNSLSRAVTEPPSESLFKESQLKETEEEKPTEIGVVRGEGEDEFLIEERKEEVEAELGGLEEPFLDPTAAAAGGAGFKGVMSLKEGMKLMPSLGRAITAGLVGGIADYPIGAATELVEEKHEGLALPFNIIAGMVTGATLESAIEEGIVLGYKKAGVALEEAPELIESLVKGFRARLADDLGQIGNFTKGGKELAAKHGVDYIGEADGLEYFNVGKATIAIKGLDETQLVKRIEETKKLFGQSKRLSEEADFKSWFKGSTVTDEGGKPKAVYHSGSFRREEDGQFIIDDPKGGIHFGTEDAAMQRIGGKAIDDALQEIEVYRNDDGTYGFEIEGADYGGEYLTRAEAEDAAEELAMSTEASDELFDEPLTEVFLSIKNPKKVRDQGADWSDAIEQAKKEGHDGIVYVNEFEDKGSLSYIVFDSDQIRFTSDVDEETINTSIIQKLNDTLKNEIGAVGDIEGIKQRLKAKGMTDQEFETKYREVLEADLTGPPPTEKYLGNINQERLSTTDDIKNLINLNTEQFREQFTAARRGVRTWEETEEAANKYTLRDLLGREVGEAYNPEQALHARMLQIESAENLRDMQEKIRLGDASDKEKVAFMQAFHLHYGIMEQVAGITAEAGRTLNIFRKMAGAGDINEIREIMKNMPATPEELAQAIADMDSPLAVNRLVKGTMRATSKDMFLEAWINGLLSGPQTHAVNTISTGLFGLWQIPERYLASLIGKAISGDEAIQQAEALNMAYGMVEGFKDGLVAFGKVAKTGMPTDELTKLEFARQKAITAANVREMPLIKKLAPNAFQEGGVAARAVDLIGEGYYVKGFPVVPGVRTPSRYLMAEDEFFKSIGYRMELRAQAIRTAKQEGLEGDEAAQRIFEILDNPAENAPNVHLAAIDHSRYATFTNALESKIGKAMTSASPTGKFYLDVPLKLILPFVRTPTRLIGAGLERTPAALLTRSADIFQSADKPRRDLALARMALGSMVMATTAAFAAQGYIRGAGPSDPKLQANLRRQKIQPYSVKIGDKWVSFSRIEPLGILLGLAADFTEISGFADPELQPELDDLAETIVKAISKNVTSKTWLRGLTEAFKAWDDPDRYGNRFIQNYVKTLVPTAVAQVERTIDPELEAIYSKMDALKSRIPEFALKAAGVEPLPPRLDLWGNPVSQQIGEGERPWVETALSVVNPFYISEEKTTPIDQELTRLKLGISKPSRKQTILGMPLELTPEMHNDFIKAMNEKSINGKDLKVSLNQLVKSKQYKRLHNDAKRQMIRDRFNMARKIARSKLVQKYPQLSDLATAWKLRLAEEQQAGEIEQELSQMTLQ